MGVYTAMKSPRIALGSTTAAPLTDEQREQIRRDFERVGGIRELTIPDHDREWRTVTSVPYGVGSAARAALLDAWIADAQAACDAAEAECARLTELRRPYQEALSRARKEFHALTDLRDALTQEDPPHA